VPNACSAIFARYSSDLQREASIEDQVRACLARIVAEGWERAATYTDHGLSGASRLRPGYQELLEGARAGAFEVVIAEALDRLSRDQEDMAALYKHLAFWPRARSPSCLKGTTPSSSRTWRRRRGAGSRAGCARAARAAGSATATGSSASLIPAASRSGAARPQRGLEVLLVHTGGARTNPLPRARQCPRW
jgi:hypothetical protein